MRRVYASYVVLGLLLWPVPLLNVLQVESAAVVAFVAYFVAGWSALCHFQGGEQGLLREVGHQLAALLVPLGMLTVAQIWAPNCTYAQGLLFYALFPGITVIFAVTIAYALTGAGLSRPFLSLGGLGLVVSVAGPIYDLGFHPQLYTYNHVFGGVLGPIYDEQLAVRSGLFVFRGLTLLWAGAAALLGARMRGRGPKWGLPVCALIIGAVYWFGTPLGFNTSAERLQQALGGHLRTEHFDLYYDPDRLEPRVAEALADDHEAYYDHIRTQLAIEPADGPERIQSYLYPNEDMKARLTGARSTSVTPVWLGAPQMHLLVDRVDPSLGHELAHVFSRPHGLPLLHASWAPGLVEGWAVALEPPDPYPSAHDLVSVATAADSVGALSSKADAIASRLSPWGFWTGRSAVSYAAMGSFVQYLLDTYGPGPLKQVYAWGNFEEVYGKSLASLAEEWARMLRGRPLVARSAHEVVFRQFTQPSLFETECPHYVPSHRRQLQAARRAARRGDSVEVDLHLRNALAAEPRYPAAHAALARRRLARGEAASVHRQLDTLNTSNRPAVLQRLLADAHAILGDSSAARQLYHDAWTRTPRYAHDFRTRLFLRDAVANRPDVVGILVSGHTPVEQAQLLAELDMGLTPSVRVWQALRVQDAHRYARADSLWHQVGGSVADDGSRARRQAWRIQRAAWQAEAAYRSGHWERAVREARSAARRAAARGARAWAETVRAWATRALRSDSPAE